jgi:phosphoribosylformimino-5-aminoimidazole carboxamide ribotide isomerase
MEIIPVLDLLDGHVVRGVGGQREVYRPIQSALVGSSRALDIAKTFRDQFGLTRLYVADLNAIQNQNPDLATIESLVAADFELMLDAGLTDHRRAQDLLDVGAESLIAGLETLPGPEALAILCQRMGSERILFSLDLQSGLPLGVTESWGGCDPVSLASQAVKCGIQRMIVLDLTGVGVGDGVSTLELCGQLRARYPALELITGGGVRGVDDLRTLHEQGLDGVLVASSLHDGSLVAEDLVRVARMM